MKKFLRTFSIGSFALGLTIGIVGTAIGSSRAGSSVFPDVPAGSYYDAAIGEMHGLGIVTGFGDGTFRPDDGLTRGQAAVMMQRLRNDLLGAEAGSGRSSSRRSSSARSSSSRSSSSSSGSGSSVSSSFSAAATNTHGKFRFTTTMYRQDENESNATISVVRTGGKTGMVTVDYKLVDATARGDSDFEKQEGTLVFEDGETGKTFSIRLVDDTEIEGDETFTMELSNATGGAETIEPRVSTLTVLDDETASSSSAAASDTGPQQGTFRYSALVFTAQESQGTATVSVERVGGSQGAVSVHFSTADGTAKNGLQYTKASGTLNFAPGETLQSFTVPLEDNGDIGGNKTVTLSLDSPAGGAAVKEGATTSQLTIVDDEVGSFGSGSFRFSEGDYDVLESDGFVDITVMRQGGSKGEASVRYATSDGTARQGSDYEEAEGTLTFRDGEASKAFRIKILSDIASDGGESVNVDLSGPVGAGLAAPSSASLIIY